MIMGDKSTKPRISTNNMYGYNNRDANVLSGYGYVFASPNNVIYANYLEELRVYIHTCTKFVALFSNMFSLARWEKKRDPANVHACEGRNMRTWYIYIYIYMDCIWFMVIHPIIGILRMGVFKSYSITGLRAIPQCGNGPTPWYLHNPFPRP